ncbi:MAG: UbiA family prenyltransferase [Candidatus Methanomethylicia archaeon]|jgi:geranylgeranylglycerol-phosphate geranylgeranyltransferase|nr:UbiA family prenyltransferase [Candidatus Methanomethylicia archaeon]MCQ5340463.1 UbiA family prenyltransferase [Candidatus Methanomethylicia archaeon]NHV45866.1 UbiA family prenyltransferase [Candidatus Verstraetearchaeota archaeon]
MKPWRLFLDYLLLIRPLNSIMMGLAVIIGEVTILGAFPKIEEIIFGFFIGFFLTAFSMVLNDIMDIEIDRINVPNRPLPSGRISINNAKFYSIILAIIGILLTFYFSIYAIIIAFSSLIVSILYNTKAKKTGLLGNIMVAYCVAIPFLFGAIITSNSINMKILTFFMLAFLSTIGREIIKGIADIKGDKIKNIKTLALSYGTKKAAIIASLFYLSAIILSILPIIVKEVGLFYLFTIIFVDLGLIYCSIKILRSQERTIAIDVKNKTLIFMLLALLAFLIDSLCKF